MNISNCKIIIPRFSPSGNMALAVIDLWMPSTSTWQRMATIVDAVDTYEQRYTTLLDQLNVLITRAPDAVMQCAHCRRALSCPAAMSIVSRGVVHVGQPAPAAYTCVVLACRPGGGATATYANCIANVNPRVYAQWQTYSQGHEKRRLCGKCHGLESDPVTDKYKVCGKCRMVHYCSPQCQQEDWPKHKMYCTLVTQ